MKNSSFILPNCTRPLSVKEIVRLSKEYHDENDHLTIEEVVDRVLDGSDLDYLETNDDVFATVEYNAKKERHDWHFGQPRQRPETEDEAEERKAEERYEMM